MGKVFLAEDYTVSWRNGIESRMGFSLRFLYSHGTRRRLGPPETKGLGRRVWSCPSPSVLHTCRGQHLSCASAASPADVTQRPRCLHSPQTGVPVYPIHQGILRKGLPVSLGNPGGTDHPSIFLPTPLRTWRKLGGPGKAYYPDPKIWCLTCGPHSP